MATTKATGATKKAPARRRTTKAEVHPLAHLIPDQRADEEYVSRTINGILDLDILAYAHEAKMNVLLYGPTGPGKTSMVEAYAARSQSPLATLHCNGAVDPGAAFGAPIMLDDRSIVFQESDALQVIRNGGVLYFDEINFLPPKITATFHGLLDRRRQITLLDKAGELVRAHDRLLIVATYNPDYEGTRPLNPAFRNRFPLKIHWDYDREVENELVFSDQLVEFAWKLRDRAKAGDIMTPVTTNMLIEFETIAIDLGYDFAVENFLSSFQDDERGAVRDVLILIEGGLRKSMDELANFTVSES